MNAGPVRVRGELDDTGQPGWLEVAVGPRGLVCVRSPKGVTVKFPPEKVEDVIQALKDMRAEALQGQQWPLTVVMWLALLGALVERLTAAQGSVPW